VQFCKDNADNQGVLFEYLDFFLKMMGKVQRVHQLAQNTVL
jgi:hypothetical protein